MYTGSREVPPGYQLSDEAWDLLAQIKSGEQVHASIKAVVSVSNDHLDRVIGHSGDHDDHNNPDKPDNPDNNDAEPVLAPLGSALRQHQEVSPVNSPHI